MNFIQIRIPRSATKEKQYINGAENMKYTENI